MTESNTPSNLLKSLAHSVAPEEYLINKAKIAEAKALIGAYEEMNEAGKQNHDEFSRELERKIREGEQARMLLEQLKSQSTHQVSPPMPIQRQAIDYPSSTSRIEEIPSYNPGSGHSQQVQYNQSQGVPNDQQARNFVPQAAAQPVGSSSYQQLSSQQWSPSNLTNDGRYQQTSHQLFSQHLQQNDMQNSSSRGASYAPFGFPIRRHQHSTGQDQGKHDNYPMNPTQESRHVPSQQEPLHHNFASSNQRQMHTATSAPQLQIYSSLQAIPAQAPDPSSYAASTNRFIGESSLPQKIPPQAAVSHNQAIATGNTYPQWQSSHKATNIANQSQLPVATVAASWPDVPQPNAPSADDHYSSSNPAMFGRPINPVPVVVATSPNPIPANPQTNPKGDATSLNQAATPSSKPPQLIAPTTVPSRGLDPPQYVREWREIIKSWEGKAPPNSYFDHPSKTFTVYKDDLAVTRIIIRGNGQMLMWGGNVDQFCDHWLRRQNVTASSVSQQPSITPRASANSQSNAQKAIPSTVRKATPSTVHKASMSTLPNSSFSRFQSATFPTPQLQRPEDPQPGASQTPSISWVQPLTSSTAQTPTSVSVSETPRRQLSTLVNGVPRSVKQADKKVLASHILFGLGKRLREPDPTALTEPKPKRLTQQGTGQIVSPSANGTVDQATLNQNVPLQTTPTGALVVSSSWQQPLHHIIPIPPATPQETKQTSPSLGDQQHLVNVTPEIPFTSKVAETASTELHRVSETFSDQTPLNLQDASIAQAAFSDKQERQVPLSVVQADSRQEIILDHRSATSSGSSVAQSGTAASVPIVISSAPARTATLPPSPVPSKALAAVSSLPPSAIKEDTTQPVASSTLKPLSHPDALAKLQRSFIDVTSPVPSPLESRAPTSAQMAQPLFLPSPASSPGVDAESDNSISNVRSPSFDLRNSSNSAKRKNRAYVLAPPRPKYLIKYLQLKQRKMSRGSLKRNRMTSRGSVSTSVAEEEDFYNPPESHSPSYDYEKQAVQLACSRLQELSCKWDGCLVKMNSVDALICHLNRQHKPSSTSHGNSFLCRWSQCGRRCNLQEKHLEKHAFLPLNCPYEDCDESFRSVPPLWRHMRTEHENSELKPSAQPSYPKLKSPPTAIPGVIPSYMITTMRVNPTKISNERHAVMGPWVLRNIAGLERERLTGRKNVRSWNGDVPDEEASNDYVFLTARPIRYSSNLSQPVNMKVEDLDSENISKMVDEGLTLWGGEKKEKECSMSVELLMPVGTEPPNFGPREHRSEVERTLTELIVAS